MPLPGSVMDTPNLGPTPRRVKRQCGHRAPAGRSLARRTGMAIDADTLRAG